MLCAHPLCRSPCFLLLVAPSPLIVVPITITHIYSPNCRSRSQTYHSFRQGEALFRLKIPVIVVWLRSQRAPARNHPKQSLTCPWLYPIFLFLCSHHLHTTCRWNSFFVVPFPVPHLNWLSSIALSRLFARPPRIRRISWKDSVPNLEKRMFVVAVAKSNCNWTNVLILTRQLTHPLTDWLTEWISDSSVVMQ